ncbi:hypothetical protein [Mesoterricola sediminis]|uniref:Uncharacterized protein n=1 Tax=Mesoterricola sediminis TaxID=2927980 RepID=A0AA48H746_9BACT|nr:hypothetical protein [Mesoterricola sediminis]BDU77188.1 hypothetical protein METESE_21460 [Mesoterricola sediminis]
MGNLRRALLSVTLVPAFALAQTPAPAPAPALAPGEGLSIASPERGVRSYGDALAPGPMGPLAHLLWVRLEGDAWASAAGSFKCTGKAGPFTCSAPKGHGRVDLPRALQSGCSLALLGWAMMSADQWRQIYGEGAARVRMLEIFAPFAENRVPPGEDIPPLDMTWFGEGDRLRTSPDALARWLADPAQEEVLRLYRRLFLSFIDETFKKNAWWYDAVEAPAPGGGTRAWVVGGNGLVTAVLRLPPGATAAQARARFMAILVGR